MAIVGTSATISFWNPIRIGFWICEVRREGAFVHVVFRFPREADEYVFVVDYGPSKAWELFVDDDKAESLGSVRVESDRVTLIDFNLALVCARALRHQHKRASLVSAS